MPTYSELIEWLFRKETSNFATLIGYLVIVGGGLFAFWRFKQERRARRVSLLLERLATFDGSPGARNATMMLYNHDRMIPLWDPDEPPERRYERVTWSESALALVPDEIRPMVFDRKLSSIRDCFEDYLSKLGEVNLHLTSGVINKSDAKAIIAPWLRRFGLQEHRTELVRNLRLYIYWRGLIDVLRLFETFKIKVTEEEVRREWAAVDRELNGKSTSKARLEAIILRRRREGIVD